MNSKKDPEDLILLSSGFDLVQAVMLLFCTEATFHAGSPFLAKLSSNDLPVILMLTSPALSFKVCYDFMLCTSFAVGVGGVDVIG